MPHWWVSVLWLSGITRSGAIVGSSRAGWQRWRWGTIHHRAAEATAGEWPSAGEDEGLAGGPNMSGLASCVLPGARDQVASFSVGQPGAPRRRDLQAVAGTWGGNRPSETPSFPRSAAGGPPLGTWGSWSRPFRELQDSKVDAAAVLLAGVSEDAEMHIHCCDVCTAQKVPSRHSHVPLQQYLIGRPWRGSGWTSWVRSPSGRLATVLSWSLWTTLRSGQRRMWCQIRVLPRRCD